VSGFFASLRRTELWRCSKWGAYSNYISSQLFHTQKGPPGNRATLLLWEAVPTEAKPSELSGARVCSPPTAVKNVFQQISKPIKSITYIKIDRFVPVFSGFYPNLPQALPKLSELSRLIFRSHRT
jgi:hypothetical protein